MPLDGGVEGGVENDYDLHSVEFQRIGNFLKKYTN